MRLYDFGVTFILVAGRLRGDSAGRGGAGRLSRRQLGVAAADESSWAGSGGCRPRSDSAQPRPESLIPTQASAGSR